MTRPLHTSITKRTVRQKNREGKLLEYDRYLLNYRDPVTDKRVIKRFDTRKEAEEARNTLIAEIAEGMNRYSKKDLTVAEAVDYWLESVRRRIMPGTYKFYCQTAEWIKGPVLVGTKADRRIFKQTGVMPKGTRQEPMIGHVKISELTTAQIRRWNEKVEDLCTPYMAVCSKKNMKTVLDIVAEEYNIHVPKMPRRVGQGRKKKPRLLLDPEQVGQIIEYGRHDPKWGLYYIFPIMAGTRPSEQLGLFWDNVDFERNCVYITQTQNEDGTIKDCPKTEAGNRMIPMTPWMMDLLREWKERCPRHDGKLQRVFPSQGWTNKKGEHVRAGGSLTIFNYRNRVWYPMLDKLGLPRIAPYAARHMMISNLQAQGVDVATVSRIAGHANPNITMQYYTHGVRKLDPSIMEKLGDAYGVH